MGVDRKAGHRDNIGRGSKQKAVSSAKRPFGKPHKARFDAVRLDGQRSGRGEYRAASHVEIDIKDKHDCFAFGGFGEIAIHGDYSCNAGRTPGHDIRYFIANAHDARADGPRQTAEILSVAQDGLHRHAELDLAGTAWHRFEMVDERAPRIPRRVLGKLCDVVSLPGRYRNRARLDEAQRSHRLEESGFDLPETGLAPVD